MADSPLHRYGRWKLNECLAQHPELRIVPAADGVLQLRGELEVDAVGPDGTRICDQFVVELEIPDSFPPDTPTAREIGGRIPKSFHKLKGDYFCLGSPTALRIQLATAPTIVSFVNKLVIPYLYGFAYFEKFGRMPFGELDHGKEGLLQHFAELFGVSSRTAALEMVRLSSLKKRVANKAGCPCGSGKRLGRCHNRILNRYRDQLGRRWFRNEFAALKPRRSSFLTLS